MYHKSIWDGKIRNMFGLPEDANIIYFRHPKEMRYMEIEYINPTHKAILWGRLKRKYGKDKNINHKIKAGRVKIPFVMLFGNWLDRVIVMVENFMHGVNLPELLFSFVVALLLFAFIYQVGVNGVFICHYKIATY